SDLEKNASSVAELVSRVPEHKLPMHYAWADIFCFPTIEDGSPVVIAQALASGLPVLATTNCSAPDLIVDGQNGWVLPIRAPEAFVDRLRWCHTHRHALGRMAHDLMMVRPKRAWDDVARDFEDLIDG
ncbi:MAG TPA: glycosyltransferase, partial [Ramlibacter sp.]|nr:glycosyltransferase [Ramlibacter sp.]